MPERTYDGELSPAADPVNSARPSPWVDARGSRRCLQDRGELLFGPPELSLPAQLSFEGGAEVDEDLDIERGVSEPRTRQWAARPVDRGVLLGQLVAQHDLRHRGET